MRSHSPSHHSPLIDTASLCVLARAQTKKSKILYGEMILSNIVSLAGTIKLNQIIGVWVHRFVCLLTIKSPAVLVFHCGHKELPHIYLNNTNIFSQIYSSEV